MEIYYNGRIYINDGSEINDTAVVLDKGIIRETGSDDIINKYPKANIYDLKGALVLPGFVDSHMHFMLYAMERSFVDLTGTSSLEDVLGRLREALNECLASGTALRGTGFNHNYWSNPVLPTREDLDSISTEVPIIIYRTCHHISVANTPALKLAGMLDSNPDGILKEDEQYPVEESLPPLTIHQIKDMMIEAAREVVSKGITEIHTDDLYIMYNEVYGRTVIDAYSELDKVGKLPMRVYEQCNLPSMEKLQAFLDDGFITGKSTGNFTIGPLKILGDGSLGARTAAMKKDYLDDPGNRGILLFTDEELKELVTSAHKAGMQIAIHGIGDRSIEQIIDAFDAALREHPKKNHRHGVVHCQITHAEDIRRMKDLGIMAYIQPVFIKADQHIVEDRVGCQLTTTSYDWRTMEDMGIHLAGGSDCPVEHFDILPNMYYACTCKEPGAEKPWHPEKALTLEETIYAFTSEGAYASFSEGHRGKILPGFDADLTIIDTDITDLPPEALLEAQVIMTIVGGKVVYKSEV